MDSLWFERIDDRLGAVGPTYAATCTWLLSKREYLEWFNMQSIENHHGILWIKGKPGSVKSTLMKFLVATARKTDATIVSFFFNARGQDLEKSTEGMYRSLIIQIMTAIPSAQESLDLARQSSQRGFGKLDWNENELRALFESLVRNLGSRHLICFIDALDECHEDQIREMVEFLEDLGQLSISSQTRFQVCLSSRHYPHISIDKSIQIVLEDEENHKTDIRAYINGKLKVGRSKKAEEIKISMERKSGNIFLWVVLVVPMLKKAFDQGKSHALEKLLNEIPEELDDLFQDILSRDRADMEEFVLCLQWLLFAKRPMSREEMYHAMLVGNNAEFPEISSEDVDSQEEMGKYILSCSKGFAEVTKTKAAAVQFIHESVREYFLKKLVSNSWHFNLDLATSQNSLKECCVRYITLGGTDGFLEGYYDMGSDSRPAPVLEHLPKASTQEAKDLRNALQANYPFLDYAVQNLLYHADAAERLGVSQLDFLRTFDRRKWVRLDIILEKFEIRRHCSEPNMLYILAERHLNSLVRLQKTIEHNPIAAVLSTSNERYCSPIIAATAKSIHGSETIDALVQTLDMSSVSRKLKIQSSFRCTSSLPQTNSD